MRLKVVGCEFTGRVAPRKDFSIAVVDANNLCQRAFGVPANSVERTHEALLSLVFSMLSNILHNENFDFAYLVFDHGRDWRNAKFKEGNWLSKTAPKGYKGNRPKREKELYDLQMGVIDEFYNISQALGIPVIDCKGVEADDIIYQICCEIPNGYKTVISADEDLIQCIKQPKTYWLSPIKNQYTTWDIFERVQGYSVENFFRVKAMLGDKSDNIEGVFGLSEKTLMDMFTRTGEFPWNFKKWLEKWGTDREKKSWLNDQILGNLKTCYELVDLDRYEGYLPTPERLTRPLRKPKDPDYSATKNINLSSKTLRNLQFITALNQIVSKVHRNIVEYSDTHFKGK